MGLPIPQPGTDRFVADQICGRSQELRCIEWAENEALEVTRHAQTFEDRHVDKKAGRIAPAFLHQHYGSAGRGAIIGRCQIHRSTAHGLRIHVVSQRPAITRRIGLHIEDRGEDFARLLLQGRPDHLVADTLGVQPSFERPQLTGRDYGRPSNAFRTAVIGIQPEFGNKPAEHRGGHVSLSGKQGRPCS